MFEEISQIDSKICESREIAYQKQLGFLNSNIHKCGSGMEVSVILNLFWFGIFGSFKKKLLTHCSKLDLNLRGLFNNGEIIGSYYKISNKNFIGLNEREIINQIVDFTHQIIDLEKNARASIFKKSPEQIHNYVANAYAILRFSSIMTEKDAINYISSLRSGIFYDMFEKFILREN